MAMSDLTDEQLQQLAAQARAQAPGADLLSLQSKLKGYGLEREKEIEQLRQYMQNYAQAGQQPQPLDLRPIAAWVSGVTGNKQLYDAAVQQAKESEDARMQKLIANQQQLAKLSGSGTSAVDLFKLANASRRIDIAERGLKKSQDSLDLRKEALKEGLIQKYEKSIEGKQTLDAAYGALEKNIGFPLDSYDYTTNSVKKQSVDLPGVSVPLVGRVSFYSEQARRIDDAMARVFNTELKDRSGAAVTSTELERMKNEFSSGKFQTEPEKLKALQEYKQLLNEEIGRRAAAFPEAVREEYAARLQKTVPPQTSPQNEPETTKVWQGTTYRFKDGHWVGEE